MKLNEMIFAIESREGMVETNFLLTLDDVTEMMEQSGDLSVKDAAGLFSDLGKTLSEPDWAKIETEEDRTFFMSYCRNEKHLLDFLDRRFNGEDITEVRFDYERCSSACKEKLALYGISPDGTRDRNVSHEYSLIEHRFRKGETLHNFNGKDYKVLEILAPKNLLLLDMSNGSFVVGAGTELYMRQVKGDSEEPEIGIEWGHGVYLLSEPSGIDFQCIREEYSETETEKTREDIRLEQEDYFRQLHKLADNPHCSEEVREFLREIMRAEFCTDKYGKFAKNLSDGIYDKDSAMKVFPISVGRDMVSILNVRGTDREDAIGAVRNIIPMAEIHRDEPKMSR